MWNYLQSRNSDTDVENKCMDTKEEKEAWDELGDCGWHALLYIKQITNKNIFILFMGFLRQGYWRDLPFPSPVDHSLSEVSSSHVWMWELDYKESWAPKNWCFWTAVLDKTIESPDSKEIQPVHPKGNQSWMFTGRTDAEWEAPILWPLVAKNWLIGKDPDAGKDWM